MKTVSKQEKFKKSINPLSFLAYGNQDNYCSNVLIGNWFNERQGSKHHDSKCIVPGLLPHDCIHSNSVYAESYQQRVPSQAQRVKDYIDWKQKSFHNLIVDLQSSVRFLDSSSYLHNMSTTKDIHYDLQPRLQHRSLVAQVQQQLDEAQLPPLRETQRSKLKAAEQDIMGSYGNYTNFGLREWKRCNELSTKCRPVDRSTYMETYGARS